MYPYLKNNLLLNLMLLGMIFIVLVTSGCNSLVQQPLESAKTHSEQLSRETSKLIEQPVIAHKTHEKAKWRLLAKDDSGKYYLSNKSHWSTLDANIHEIDFKRSYKKNQNNVNAAAPYIHEEARIEVNCSSKQISTQHIGYYDWLGRLVDKPVSNIQTENYPPSISIALLEKFCSN